MPPRQTLADPGIEGPPFIWLLGEAGSGQTSLVAGLLDRWRSVLRHELASATPTAETLAWPPEAPRIRFLVTTGLNGETLYDPAEDIAFIGRAPALILAVLRADEPDQKPLHDILTRLKEQGLDWPVLLVQTNLHTLYPSNARHPMPYAYGADGLPGPAVPELLAAALNGQRTAFAALARGIVPVDLTVPAQGIPPGDDGLAPLQATIRRLAPEMDAALAPRAPPETYIWTRGILPWAVVAAVGDAIPGLAGLPGAAAQAILLRAVARRFGLTSDAVIWANALGLIGIGLVLRSGLNWLMGGAGLDVRLASMAAWVFLISCLMGALAIRFCRNEAVDTHPSAPGPGQTREAEQGIGRGGARF